MNWIKMAVAGLALCASASVASAQGAPPAGAPPQGGQQGGPGMRGGRGMAMLFEGITLTEAQQTKVDSITAAYRAERQKMMPNGMGGPPDEGMRAKMMEMMNKQNADIRAVLTADQQKTFDANVEKRKQMMQQRQGGN
jgi:Spy/CpxP family protein refolding chaperone